MNPACILILDLDPKACPEDHGSRLSRLLRDCTSSSVVDIQSFHRLPSERLTPPPALLLLRPAYTESLPKLVPVLRSRWRRAPILGLFCTGENTPAAVSQALRTDLDDFLCCPFRDLDVFPRVQRLLQDKEATITAPQTEEMHAHLRQAGLVGESGPFLRVVEHVLRVAHSDATILLAGETGTGKELVARAVHYGSPRRAKPFVPVNCGALPDHLVENELFGHTKGAYTDASSPEKGLVTEAEGGTLFLDEVDALSASAQVKLLRFLQDRVYRPVGNARGITADVRIIAATNADLWQQVQARRFREDLYYRLHVIALRLPPLRERRDDIPRLAGHFLRRYTSQYGRGALQFSAAALHKLTAYPWPGNVRELETVVQRAVLLTSAAVLHPDDIELLRPSPQPVAREESFGEAKAQVIAQFERSYLITLLSAHGGNITRAAKQAGKERRAFTRLLQKYGLHRDVFRAPSAPSFLAAIASWLTLHACCDVLQDTAILAAFGLTG
jgi:DNA-binding NtrC family response regulator